MKTCVLLVGVLLMSAAPCSDAIEQQITELAKEKMSYLVASKWFKLSKEIKDEDLRQEVLKAAGAAVVCANRNDTYVDKIRPLIKNADEFEKEYFEPCGTCAGTGKQSKTCSSCKGSKKCTFGGCNGGTVITHRISGNVTGRCSKCKGSGVCQACRGNGSVTHTCYRCNGLKKNPSKSSLVVSYRKHVDLAKTWKQELERRERERKAAEEKAKAEKERLAREREERERKAAEEKARLEARRRARERELEEERKREEKLRARMRELGFVNVDGKWMTPGSVRYVRYMVFQIYEPGHALCRDGSGRVFCLLYSAKDNRNLSEGDVLVNDLYRCGTYSYITVNGAPSTVARFAIDLEVALQEIKRQRD